MNIIFLLFGIFVVFLSKEIIIINEEFFVISAFSGFVFFFYKFASSFITNFFENEREEIKKLYQLELNNRLVKFNSILSEIEINSNLVNSVIILFSEINKLRGNLRSNKDLEIFWYFHLYLMKIELKDYLKVNFAKNF